MRFLILLFPSFVLASMESAHTQGATFAASLNGAVQASLSLSQSEIPGFGGEPSLPQDPGALAEAALLERDENPAARAIEESAKTREFYNIDATTDPLVQRANAALLDPQAAMNEVTETEQDKEGREVICEESKEESLKTCTNHLEVVLEIIKREEIHWTCGQGNHRPDDPNCGARQITRKIHEDVKVKKEGRVNTCQHLEELRAKGLCRIIETLQSPKSEVRQVQGKPVTRDQWDWTVKYACLYPSANTCAALRAQGCVQTQSTCIQKQSGTCVVWQQTYRCGGSSKRTKRSLGEKNPFCFKGNCSSATYKRDTDIMEALSSLAILKEAQKDLQSDPANSRIIFKGQDRRCSKDCISFMDCCGRGSGWGKSIGLASCSGAEKELAAWRDPQNNRCVKVGTYCSKKVPVLGCLTKKTTFCCFGNKLSRVVQEQGRRQLGKGFGDPKNPICEGLSPEEMSRLDFSKMDLTELYADIKSRFKPQHSFSGGLQMDRLKTNMGTLAKPVLKGGERG